MATAVSGYEQTQLSFDPQLMQAVHDAVQKSLTMCDCQVRCVGVSTVPSPEVGSITALIGVHGNVSGFITVNMAERFAIRAVNGLLQDDNDRLSAQVIDGVGEIANIVIGSIKGNLSGTIWAFPHITVPSVIVGTGYRINFARGLDYFSTTFELHDPEAVCLSDRLMQVSISLLRL